MKYYLDTEFDGFGGRLISLALVREDGAFFYGVLEDDASDPWVAENVIPILEPFADREWGVMPKEAMQELIEAFLRDDGNPIIVTDWPDDIRYFCQILIAGPGKMIKVGNLKFEMHRVDAYPTDLEGAVQHNAYWDAMALRHKLSNTHP